MKTFILSSIALLSLFGSSLARPGLEQRATCTSPKLRKEWSAATATEKSTYIAAVKCLTTKPSKIGLTTTLFDDFTYVHMNLNRRIHNAASFLPWHRYFLAVYEKELNSCGYSGTMLYWDWEKASNAGNVTNAAIFSTSDGFGGDGIRSDDWESRCVTTGPFKTLRPAYWNLADLPHCLTRQFYKANPAEGIRDLFAEQYGSQVMNSVRNNTMFVTFAPALESTPHSAVHSGIGGEMPDPMNSVNDPLFFLHHTQVDRVWWLWQQQNPSARNSDYGGLEYANQPATLDTVLFMNDLAPDRTVRDYMTTKSNYLCYKY